MGISSEVLDCSCWLKGTHKRACTRIPYVRNTLSLYSCRINASSQVKMENKMCWQEYARGIKWLELFQVQGSGAKSYTNFMHWQCYVAGSWYTSESPKTLMICSAVQITLVLCPLAVTIGWRRTSMTNSFWKMSTSVDIMQLYRML